MTTVLNMSGISEMVENAEAKFRESIEGFKEKDDLSSMDMIDMQQMTQRFNLAVETASSVIKKHGEALEGVARNLS